MASHNASTRTDRYDLRVLSLGAGTQSSALYMLAVRGELPEEYLPVDAAIFADTGDEPGEVYDWLEVLEREGGSTVPIHVVHGKDGTPLSEWATDTSRTHSLLPIPTHIVNPDGSKGLGRRHCTTEYKIAPIKRQIRRLLGGSTRNRKVLQLIGMSMDEVVRMKPSHVGYIDNAWPLVDMRWRRQQSISYLEGLGLGTPPRSACVYCPFHSDSEWRRIRDNDPKGWQKAVEVDRALRDANRRLNESYTGGKSKGAYDGDMYVHHSGVPLEEADLSTAEDHGQLNMFASECEGMCGA